MATRGPTAGKVTKSTELLLITRDELGTFARIATPLADQGINIECFTGYEWGTEAAFRIVTNNNRRAAEVLRGAGFPVQESPIVLWTAENRPGQFKAAATALAEARVNTHCVYQTANADSPTAVVAYNTNDPDRTMDILRRLR